MKRLGNIWSDVIDPVNGLVAVIDGTRFKRGQHQVRKLLNDDHTINIGAAEKYVAPIIEKLENKTWRHGEPRHQRRFCRNKSNGGKWRDLYIPTLEDHIVAHMLMQASMEAFTRGMYPHCCGSVPGRGINHILHCVKHWMINDKECRYFVKLDIRKFFDNIDKDILKRKLSEKIKDKDALWAFGQIIDSAPLACPVGYYTSPWFANLYLEKFDWFVVQQLYKERRGKRINYVRHYLRYMDDMLLIGTSKNDLYKSVRAIQNYLHDELGLEIKAEWEIKKIGKHELVDGKWQLKKDTYWCDIGGYKFCKDATILRDGIFLSTRRMAKGQKYTIHWCRSMNSRIGWAKHCNCQKFLDDYIRPYVNIKETRRIIADVDKKRKWRIGKADKDGKIPESCDSAEELQVC